MKKSIIICPRVKSGGFWAIFFAFGHLSLNSKKIRGYTYFGQARFMAQITGATGACLSGDQKAPASAV